MAGARPAAALPTLTCQLSCGVTFAVNVGNGPGLLLLPNSQPNDGGGIFGSDWVHDVIVVEQPPTVVTIINVAVNRLVRGQRVPKLMVSRQWQAARQAGQGRLARPFPAPRGSRRDLRQRRASPVRKPDMAISDRASPTLL